MTRCRPIEERQAREYHLIRRLVIAGLVWVAIGLTAMALGGCGESSPACEKHGYSSAACRRETRAEEEHACGPGQRVEGFLDCGNRAEGERKEFREGWEEAEKEAEFYGGAR